MLTGGYELVHRAMGAQAAATVLEAEALARRHGHARVTPVHVASAILSPAPEARGLILSSSPHQLRPEDLPPCFDAALSRFPVAPPAATSHSRMRAPLLPLYNALLAALNRAQLLQHQRSMGGCRRGRRRQLANVKIELEQLVHSIVVDPGVYRAMKQAGSGIRSKPNVVPMHSNLPSPALTVCGGGNHHQPLSAKRSSHSREELAPFAGQYNHQAAIPTCRITSVQATCRQKKFAELSATNFKTLCDELERHVVPQHKDIAHGIASTVLLCRSGMMRRAWGSASSTTWLLFQGRDDYGKKVMAQQLSNLIFGSYYEFPMLNSGDSSVSGTGNLSNKRKRSRDGDNTYVMRRLLEAIQENPHRVVFISGINHMDCESESAIKNLIATGRFMGCNGIGMVNLEDAVVVLSTEETSSSRTTATSTLMNRQFINTQSHKHKGVESRRLSFDLNVCAEDVGEEEEIFVGDNVEITSVVDGVFRFN